MLKILTCIVCPIGCDIVAEIDNNTIKSIKGNKCAKGTTYLKNEIYNPMRTIATSVCVSKGDLPLVSVRVDKPILKAEIFNVMNIIKKIQLEAPVNIGDIIIKNVAGLDANVIATKNIKRI